MVLDDRESSLVFGTAMDGSVTGSCVAGLIFTSPEGLVTTLSAPVLTSVLATGTTLGFVVSVIFGSSLQHRHHKYRLCQLVLN